MYKLFIPFLLTLILVINAEAQSVIEQDGRFYHPNGIGTSNPDNRNVNHPDGSNLQDLKRSAGYLVSEVLGTDGELHATVCSCTLLNSTNQSKALLISTAEHCVKNFQVGILKEVYLSFDFEMSEATERGDATEHESISRIYKVKVKTLFKDVQSDLALLQLEEYSPDLINYAYAAGWDNRIDNGSTWSNISHPKADHKKVFIDPAEGEIKIYYGRRSEHLSRLFGHFYEYVNNWNGIQGVSPQGGSSGSGHFSSEDLLKSIHSHRGPADVTTSYRRASAISNKWYGLPGETHFSKYLDISGTWLNHIPGGYLNDLVAPDDTDFALLMSPNETKMTPGVSTENPNALHGDVLWIKPVRVFENINLSSGLIWWKILGLNAEDVSSSNLVLSVYYLDQDAITGAYTERLIYGSHVNNTTPFNNPIGFGFRGESWDCNQPPAGFPLCNRFENLFGSQGNSRDVKRDYLEATKRKNQSTWTPLSTTLVPIKIRLDNIGDEPVRVKALSFPGEVPLNALQLFEPEEVMAKFRSYQYPASKLQISQLLNIDQVGLAQGDYNKEISTGNNGGYLNLVNPNFEIGPIETSIDEEMPNTLNFTIQINNPTNDLFSYRVWIDYFNGEVPGGRNDEEYTYNFVNDPEPHDLELVKEERNVQGETVSFTYRMPTGEEIGLEAGEIRHARMRISVINGGELPEQNTTEGVGEVEDYLIKTQAPVLEEAEAALCVLNNTTDECPGVMGLSDIGTFGGVAVVMPGGSHRRLGTPTFHFPDQGDHLVLDVNDRFIHDPFSERTVSFWLYNEQGSGIHDLYDEGGSVNGFGMRLNEGNLELAVKAGSAFETITSIVPIPLNQWVHVAGIFDNGKLELYIDGQLERQLSNVGFAVVPFHGDSAGFGATAGYNAFSATNNSFNGWLDHLKVYQYAMNEGEVAFVYQDQAGEEIGSLLAGGDPPELATSTLKETGATIALKVYPNPATGPFTVLWEARQAGQATFRLLDLLGGELYHKPLSVPTRGYYSLEAPELGLPSGTYVAEVVCGATRQVKIIIIK
jgi:hypothetical protein